MLVCLQHIRLEEKLTVMLLLLVTKSYPTLLRPRELQLARLLCSWHFPDKNIGVGCHFFLQGIFPTQGSNQRLLLGRWILFH